MDHMKIAHIINASSIVVLSKQLRGEQRRLSRMNKGSNTQDYTAKRYTVKELEALRREVSSETRHLGLARAYLKGTPYLRVENSVRKGNEPSVKMIQKELANYDMYFFPEYLEAWLQEDQQ